MESVQYDCPALRDRTNRQVLYATGGFSLLVAGGIGGLGYLVDQSLYFTAGVSLLGLLLLSTALIYRMRRIGAVAWRVRLGRSHLTGDTQRRWALTCSWYNLQQIDLSGDKLVITMDNHQKLIIPARFSGYTDLTHAIVTRAESCEVPLFIDGRPWESVTVDDIFPFVQTITTGPVISRSD